MSQIGLATADLLAMTLYYQNVLMCVIEKSVYFHTYKAHFKSTRVVRLANKLATSTSRLMLMPSDSNVRLPTTPLQSWVKYKGQNRYYLLWFILLHSDCRRHPWKNNWSVGIKGRTDLTVKAMALLQYGLPQFSSVCFRA